ncbi:MAG: hypothetical protein AAGA90_13300 [Actinomycetota bacterium]
MASRSRSAAGSARTSSARTAARAPRRGPKPVAKTRPEGRLRFRSGNTVRAGLIAATLVAGGALAYIPVKDYVELRGELRELEDEGVELQRDLVDAQQTIRVAESRNEERARCYANYVRPGSESYSIPGSSGCVQ